MLRPFSVALMLLMAVPGAAWAHPGHGDGGFLSGFQHPWLGLDHVAAMLTVGLWAALLGGWARLALPAAFVAGMTGGAVLGLFGWPLPLAEPMILASVIALGAAVALALRLPLPAAALIVAAFGALHGRAHGLEAGHGSEWAFVAGALAATALLHALGLAIGLLALRRGAPQALRGAGAVAAAAGVALAAM